MAFLRALASASALKLPAGTTVGCPFSCKNNGKTKIFKSSVECKGIVNF